MNDPEFKNGNIVLLETLSRNLLGKKAMSYTAFLLNGRKGADLLYFKQFVPKNSKNAKEILDAEINSNNPQY